jgi:hypothetical protein
MSALVRQEQHPDTAYWRAIDEVGGRWSVVGYPTPAEILAAARERDVRAITLAGEAVSVAAELPGLEFVTVTDPPDVAPLLGLRRLRALSVLAWRGRLDGAAWPQLEWFAASSTPRDGGGVESLYDHPRVRDLGLGGVRLHDLAPLTAPSLEVLRLGPSPTLTSLAGIEQHADRLRWVDLERMPKLASLAELASLPALEVLKLSGLKLVTSLEDVARIPGLRMLDIGDQRGIESLAPLAGHPTLEHVAFGRTVDLDLDPLQDIPRLRLVHHGHLSDWHGSRGDVPLLQDLPATDPRVQEWRRLWA